MTHCDKKPRGKVGGSAISVYQALLHPPIESLGTRLELVKIARSMGCCICGYQSTITDDPDVEFYAEATHLVSALKKNRFVQWAGNSSVLLYVKNNRLYHVPKCGSNLLCCGNSHELLNLVRVEVISGKVRVEGTNKHTHNVDQGLKIEVTRRFNSDVGRVYETPDAARLATLLRSRVSGRVVTEPNTKDTVFKYPPVHNNYRAPPIGGFYDGGSFGGCN